MALLILIWTTIWCRRECVAAARHSNQAVYNNNNKSNLHEQLEINVVDDSEDVEAIVSEWDEVYNGVAPFDVADERRSVHGEQASAINAIKLKFFTLHVKAVIYFIGAFFKRYKQMFFLILLGQFAWQRIYALVV